ncbi:hypothetical protein PI125_g13617 [Phytophthora idaei]|nr:hypothetical protein PI125_g13617 [Phytophthora idaei]KAG3153043.1 hypothetical protein PI126_g10251 [Phytophthora idaei]
MKRQKKKEYWQFIRLLAKDDCDVSDEKLTNADEKKAYCLKCKSIMDFKIGKHYAKEHMEQYHPNDLESFIQNKEHGRDTQQGNAASRSRKRYRAQLDDSGKVIPIRAIANEQQKHVNRLLAKWVACHFRPLVIVKDEGFIAFVCFITQDLGRVNWIFLSAHSSAMKLLFLQLIFAGR